jgi:predicted DNA-binding ribbon-helix-helix protein
VCRVLDYPRSRLQPGRSAAEHSNQRWAIDITHIDCGEDGWGHLVAVIDCHDRSIVGYEFVPEKRGFRLHGHSTTLRLERAFWSVLEEKAKNEELTMNELIIKIHDTCLVANDKNLASCLRVTCLKYLNLDG